MLKMMKDKYYLERSSKNYTTLDRVEMLLVYRFVWLFIRLPFGSREVMLDGRATKEIWIHGFIGNKISTSTV